MSDGRRKRRGFTIARVVVILIALGLASEAFWFEPASLERNEYGVALNQWPRECAGLKVAVLADLHVGSPFNTLERLETIVRETNAGKPDVILLAGDYVIQGVMGGEFIEPEHAATILAGLSAPLGVFAVLGNHDWWLNAERVAKAITDNDMHMLEDRSIALTHRGCQFTLIGISDYWEGPHDVEQAFEGVPDDAPTIVFTHNPDVFPELPRPVSLGIAGHTHGGQVALPFIGRPIIPSKYGERFAAGRIVEGGQTYFISTGIGTSILPVRFGVPPEVSLLRLDAN